MKLTLPEIQKRIEAYTRYRFDLHRINEDSDAADREANRIDLLLCKLYEMRRAALDQTSSKETK